MFLRWQQGRQEGDYSKLALLPEWLSKLIKADAYLLKFPSGASVVKHKDPAPEGYKHYRANITIFGYGRMFCLGKVKRFGRLEIFRPDLYEHGMLPIKEKMYMFSFGILVKQ